MAKNGHVLFLPPLYNVTLQVEFHQVSIKGWKLFLRPLNLGLAI